MKAQRGGDRRFKRREGSRRAGGCGHCPASILAEDGVGEGGGVRYLIYEGEGEREVDTVDGTV